MRKTIIFALVLLTVAGCLKTGMPEKGGRAVRLALSLDGIEVTTKTLVEAEPYLSAPSAETPFATDVWFTLTPGEYAHKPEDHSELSIPVHTVVSHTTVNGTDAMYEGKNILYPLDEGENKTVQDPVYCVGFYPASSDVEDALNWKQDQNDGKIVTHKIDGTQDLMFADLIKGSYSENFEPQQFGHVLSWVKINVIATSEEAAKVWGKVKYLSIGGKKSTVKVRLTEVLNTPSEITFVRDEDAVDQAGNPTDTLCLKTVYTEEADKMIDLNIRGTLAGSVFCCPPEAEPKKENKVGYWVAVQTDNGSDKKDVFVPITWSDQYDTDGIGKLLIINLYFNEISVVSGVCTLSYWENTSEDLYLEEDNS